jgi:hypothetical protein
MCNLGQLARAIYQGLLIQRNALTTDTDWLSYKPGEIVHHLCREAEQEFNHCIPFRDFMEGNITGAYQPPNTAQLVQQCVSPAKSVNQNFLPQDLRQRTTPAAQPHGSTQRNTNTSSATP